MENINTDKTLSIFKEQIKDYEDLTYFEMQQIYLNYIDASGQEKEQYKDRLIKGSLKCIIKHIENIGLEILKSKHNDMGDIINSAVKVWIDLVMDGVLLRHTTISSILTSREYESRLSSELGVNPNSGINHNIINTKDIGNLISYYIDELKKNPNYKYSDFLKYLESNEKYNYLIRKHTAANAYELLTDILNDIYASGKEIMASKTTIDRFRLVLLNSHAITNDEYAKYVNPFEELERNKVIEQIQEAFNNANLSQRNREILELRYGLNGNEIHTLREIGDKFNMSRERVRQITDKALIKLSLEKDFIDIVSDGTLKR